MAVAAAGSGSNPLGVSWVVLVQNERGLIGNLILPLVHLLPLQKAIFWLVEFPRFRSFPPRDTILSLILDAFHESYLTTT